MTMKKFPLYLLVTMNVVLQGGISEPAKKLLMPQEVLSKISDFKKNIDEKKEVKLDTKCNKECVQDKQKAKELLIEAYEALYICDIHDFDDLHIWIDNYQSWSRDPMRYRKWEENRLKEKPDVAIGKNEYYITCLEESKKIRECCKDCHLLRPQLFKSIDELSSFLQNNNETDKKNLTPQEVLSKINDFKKYIDKKSEGSLVPIINKEYVADMEKAEELLHEAYEALYFCDIHMFPDVEINLEEKLRLRLFKEIDDLSSFIIYRKPRADKETVEFNESRMEMLRQFYRKNNDEKN